MWYLSNHTNRVKFCHAFDQIIVRPLFSFFLLLSIIIGLAAMCLNPLPPCLPPPVHTTFTHFSLALSQKTRPGQTQMSKPFLCHKTRYMMYIEQLHKLLAMIKKSFHKA